MRCLQKKFENLICLNKTADGKGKFALRRRFLKEAIKEGAHSTGIPKNLSTSETRSHEGGAHCVGGKGVARCERATISARGRGGRFSLKKRKYTMCWKTVDRMSTSATATPPHKPVKGDTSGEKGGGGIKMS